MGVRGDAAPLRGCVWICILCLVFCPPTPPPGRPLTRSHARRSSTIFAGVAHQVQMPFPAIPFAIKTVVVGTAATVAVVGVALPAVGFGSAGVVAGSTAAAAQSAIGNVAAGSAFATLQSVGATGVTAGTAACGATLGAAGGVARAAARWCWPRQWALIARLGQRELGGAIELKHDDGCPCFRLPRPVQSHRVEHTTQFDPGDPHPSRCRTLVCCASPNERRMQSAPCCAFRAPVLRDCFEVEAGGVRE